MVSLRELRIALKVVPPVGEPLRTRPLAWVTTPKGHLHHTTSACKRAHGRATVPTRASVVQAAGSLCATCIPSLDRDVEWYVEDLLRVAPELEDLDSVRAALRDAAAPSWDLAGALWTSLRQLHERVVRYVGMHPELSDELLTAATEDELEVQAYCDRLDPHAGFTQLEHVALTSLRADTGTQAAQAELGMDPNLMFRTDSEWGRAITAVLRAWTQARIDHLDEEATLECSLAAASPLVQAQHETSFRRAVRAAVKAWDEQVRADVAEASAGATHVIAAFLLYGNRQASDALAGLLLRYGASYHEWKTVAAVPELVARHYDAAFRHGQWRPIADLGGIEPDDSPEVYATALQLWADRKVEDIAELAGDLETARLIFRSPP